MPHLNSFPRQPSLVSSFPHYLAEHAHFKFNKHSYGSNLSLYLYLHSTVVVHLPVPEKDLQPCIFMRVTTTCVLYVTGNPLCYCYFKLFSKYSKQLCEGEPATNTIMQHFITYEIRLYQTDVLLIVK